MFLSAKDVIELLLIPVVAIIPDMGFLLLRKIFYPNPTDAVMRL